MSTLAPLLLPEDPTGQRDKSKGARARSAWSRKRKEALDQGKEKKRLHASIRAKQLLASHGKERLIVTLRLKKYQEDLLPLLRGRKKKVTMQGKKKKRLIKRFFSFPCMIILWMIILVSYAFCGPYLRLRDTTSKADSWYFSSWYFKRDEQGIRAVCFLWPLSSIKGYNKQGIKAC